MSQPLSAPAPAPTPTPTLFVNVRYFARLREALGLDGERVELPAGVATANALREHLCQRGGAWQQALAPGKAVRIAVDQTMVTGDAVLVDDAEVAFFPPVTGG